MRKKIIALILALCLCIPLCSCGQSPEAKALKAVDPLNYLSENKLIGSNVNNIISGKTEGQDYSKSKLGSKLEYMIKPSIGYMDAGTTYTRLRIYTPSNSNTIETFEYSAFWKTNEIDYMCPRVDEQYNNLVTLYGNYIVCEFCKKGTNTDKKLTYTEALDKMKKGTEGLYTIQWEKDGMLISLFIEIDNNRGLHEADVMFSK